MAAAKLTPTASDESNSDDKIKKETCKRKNSFLSKFRQSGETLRRYLYCMERRSSESSSVEDNDHGTEGLMLENFSKNFTSDINEQEFNNEIEDTFFLNDTDENTCSRFGKFCSKQKIKNMPPYRFNCNDGEEVCIETQTCCNDQESRTFRNCEKILKKSACTEKCSGKPSCVKCKTLFNCPMLKNMKSSGNMYGTESDKICCPHNHKKSFEKQEICHTCCKLDLLDLETNYVNEHSIYPEIEFADAETVCYSCQNNHSSTDKFFSSTPGQNDLTCKLKNVNSKTSDILLCCSNKLESACNKSNEPLLDKISNRPDSGSEKSDCSQLEFQSDVTGCKNSKDSYNVSGNNSLYSAKIMNQKIHSSQEKEFAKLPLTTRDKRLMLMGDNSWITSSQNSTSEDQDFHMTGRKFQSLDLTDDESLFQPTVGDDIEELETSLNYSPTGYLSSLARIHINDQRYEDSDESETLSTDNHTEDTDTTDSIPGLNYALPYLSDRLKASLAQRIGTNNFGNSVNQNQEKEELSDGEVKDDDFAETSDLLQSSDCSGRELLPKEVSSGEYMTDERTLSDLLFDLDKIDMIDRIFLHEDTDQDLSNLPSAFTVQFHSNHGNNRESTEKDDSVSDDNEADDEFECDCHFCTDSMSGQHGAGCHGNIESGINHGSNTFDDQERNGYLEDESYNIWSPGEDNDNDTYTLNVEDLSPLEFMMNDTRREIESMFENVILQMLAVHPDLLSDQAPPPASKDTIQNLPSVPVISGQTSQSVSCPICLSLYVESEIITSLPCKHSFHSTCIMAWLNKSGTCPICRSILK